MKKLFIVSAIMLLMVIAGCTPGNGPTGASSAKAITAFSLDGSAGTIDETAKTISVVMPYDTDVTALVATFTTTGANVTVNSVVQESGTTANDFTSSVTYRVTAANGSTQDYAVTVTLAVKSFILSNEGGGLITQLVANGWGEYTLYQALLLIQQSTDPSTVTVITDAFLTKLQSCPNTSAIFTTKLRDYLDSTPTSVTAVSKAAVSSAATTSAETFILSDEGGGLITQLVAAGYGDFNLDLTLLTMQTVADPSISGIITDKFLLKLASCPAGSAIFTHKLSEYPGETIAISDDCTVQTESIYGRTYYGNSGTYTLSANITGVGTGLFTYYPDTTSPYYPGYTNYSPLTSFTVSTTAYNVFAIGWAPSTTASIAISTDCTVQAVNIYGSAYYGQTGTSTLASTISGAGTAEFTYAASSVSPLIRWLLTGTYYDAFAIGWMPSK